MPPIRLRNSWNSSCPSVEVQFLWSCGQEHPSHVSLWRQPVPYSWRLGTPCWRVMQLLSCPGRKLLDNRNQGCTAPSLQGWGSLRCGTRAKNHRWWLRNNTESSLQGFLRIVSLTMPGWKAHFWPVFVPNGCESGGFLIFVFLRLQDKEVSGVITWRGIQLSDSLSNIWNPQPRKATTVSWRHTTIKPLEAALQIAICSRQWYIMVGVLARRLIWSILSPVYAFCRAWELKICELVKYLRPVFKAVLLSQIHYFFFYSGIRLHLMYHRVIWLPSARQR